MRAGGLPAGFPVLEWIPAPLRYRLVEQALTLLIDSNRFLRARRFRSALTGKGCFGRSFVVVNFATLSRYNRHQILGRKS
jgi:hypothetical protein